MAGPGRFSQPWCMDSSSLETWYNENIQRGTEDFDRDCKRAINEVVLSVQSICKSGGLRFNVDRIVKVCTLKYTIHNIIFNITDKLHPDNSTGNCLSVSI